MVTESVNKQMTKKIDNNDMQAKDNAMYNTGTLVLEYLGGFQKVLKVPVTKIEYRGSVFPKTITLRWIAEGIEFEMAFFNGMVHARLFEPENLSECTPEYQERIANCKEMIVRIVTARGGGQVDDKNTQGVA